MNFKKSKFQGIIKLYNSGIRIFTTVSLMFILCSNVIFANSDMDKVFAFINDFNKTNPSTTELQQTFKLKTENKTKIDTVLNISQDVVVLFSEKRRVSNICHGVLVGTTVFLSAHCLVDAENKGINVIIGSFLPKNKKYKNMNLLVGIQKAVKGKDFLINPTYEREYPQVNKLMNDRYELEKTAKSKLGFVDRVKAIKYQRINSQLLQKFAQMAKYDYGTLFLNSNAVFAYGEMPAKRMAMRILPEKMKTDILEKLRYNANIEIADAEYMIKNEIEKCIVAPKPNFNINIPRKNINIKQVFCPDNNIELINIEQIENPFGQSGKGVYGNKEGRWMGMVSFGDGYATGITPVPMEAKVYLTLMKFVSNPFGAKKSK